MDVIEAIKTRKSIRGFKPDPIPREILREVIAVASRAPSDVNAQPWYITIVAGEVLENIRRITLEKWLSGETANPAVPSFQYEGKYRQRQIDIAKQLFGLMGIAREDKEGRIEWRKRGFRFFDAPAAIILSVDRSIMELRSQFDIGSIAHAICLVALNYGLGTCIEDAGVYYPEVVRKYTDIPDSQRIVTSIAIGYPDWDFPANKLYSEREPVGNIINWCGFD